ncbi:MAG: hypothetical protein LBU19_08985 [Treponema sp.]|jgi:hypothetical protein|nr:hypothetical protein [Treponema sp.]
MMIIQQTIEIPSDRPISHLRLDVPLPEKHPSGTVMVEVTLKPQKNYFLGNFFTSKFYKNFDKFYGCLKDSEVFEGDSIEIVRRMRDEWDRPWDAADSSSGKALNEIPPGIKTEGNLK